MKKVQNYCKLIIFLSVKYSSISRLCCIYYAILHHVYSYCPVKNYNALKTMHVKQRWASVDFILGWANCPNHEPKRYSFVRCMKFIPNTYNYFPPSKSNNSKCQISSQTYAQLTVDIREDTAEHVGVCQM